MKLKLSHYVYTHSSCIRTSHRSVDMLIYKATTSETVQL